MLKTGAAAEAAAPAADPRFHGSMGPYYNVTINSTSFYEPYFLPVQAARGGRSGVRVYKAGRSPDETKPDEMKRSENERTKRKE